jgi:hypothetical protein
MTHPQSSFFIAFLLEFLMPMDSLSCALLTTMDRILMASAEGAVAISFMVLAL